LIGGRGGETVRTTVEELFPLATGLVLGGLLGFVRPSIRLPVGAALAVALGVLATVASGEFRVSWAYLLIDIPLVAVAAILGLLIARGLAPSVPEA
jgi:hypothetical protein